MTFNTPPGLREIDEAAAARTAAVARFQAEKAEHNRQTLDANREWSGAKRTTLRPRSAGPLPRLRSK